MNGARAKETGPFLGTEVYVVATDQTNKTLIGENGVVYHQCPDHLWADGTESREGGVLWQGSAFHGYGIRLKPLYVMEDGTWVNVFTGKERKSS